jgi:hypothetical protein
MSNNHSSARATAERIVDRLQEFLHVASGPNDDGTHSGFIIVDFQNAEALTGSEEAPIGALALLPFDLSDEDDPTELTTADDIDAAADAAEATLATLLDFIEAVVATELENDG